MEQKEYDIIIIGGGVAGLSAAIYSARYKLKTLVLDEMPGGVTKTAHIIENYPGFVSITGEELAENMRKHAEVSGAEIVYENVVNVKKEGEKIRVYTSASNEYVGDYLLIASGSKRKKLGIPGEDKLYGRGVSYCATCDAAFFKDKISSVIGGGSSALMAAVLLAEYSKKVYLIYRGPELKGEPAWRDRVLTNPKIEVLYNTNVTKVIGEKRLEKISLDSGKELDMNGMFVEIGSMPSVEVAKLLGVELNENMLIKVTKEQRTNVDRIYAAGDITDGSCGFQQIVTAVSEGAVAMYDIFKKKNMKISYK